MRFVGLTLVAALTAAFFFGAFSCPGEDECSDPCPCTCCVHGGFSLDAAAPDQVPTETTAVVSAFVSLPLAIDIPPDLPPPRA